MTPFTDLHDVPNWTTNVSCVPTALAAVSGSPLTDIGTALQAAAGLDSSALRPDYNINDWLKALEGLGAWWRETESYADIPLASRPDIAGWVSQNAQPSLVLVFCDDGSSITHVFAAQDHDWVDPCTKGKREPFRALPEGYPPYRVKRVFLVKPASSSRVNQTHTRRAGVIGKGFVNR